jgi:hypothetical protein
MLTLFFFDRTFIWSNGFQLHATVLEFLHWTSSKDDWDLLSGVYGTSFSCVEKTYEIGVVGYSRLELIPPSICAE